MTLKICPHSEMDITIVFGTDFVGSIIPLKNNQFCAHSEVDITIVFGTIMPSSSLGGRTKGLHASVGFFIQACKTLYRLCAWILWSSAMAVTNKKSKCEHKTQMFAKRWTKTKK